jgi:predicted transcriptional regulator
MAEPTMSFSARLSVQTFRLLDELARREGITKQSIAENAIRAYVASRDPAEKELATQAA